MHVLHVLRVLRAMPFIITCILWWGKDANDLFLLVHLHHFELTATCFLISGDKSMFKSIADCFQPAVNLELIEDILDVVPYRKRTNG